MAGVEAGATQAIGKNAIQTSENGKFHSSQVAIEKIGDVLKKMKGCLNKVGLKGVIMTVEEVDEAIEALNNNRFIWLHATQNNSLEHRILALEEAVKKNLVENCGRMGSKGVVGKSYASVVAPPAAKAAVRIRVPGAAELQPVELLSIAKQKIKGAYAIRQMRSHDTEVFVQSSNHRDAALSMEQPKDFKILRKYFPVEIAGVSLSTKIASGKNADNTALMSILTNASKVRIPGLQIKRIRWLQDGKEHEKARKKGHTRGSRAVCKTFKVYKEGVERARLENQIKTAEIRSEKIPATEAKYVPVNTSDEEGFTLVTIKSSETKRGPGRPRKDALVPMTSQIIATSPNAKVGIPLLWL
ncbi:putative air1 domain-containing protein [Erysiphe necator]|uniref:Putative air1 domain-containing protein n=1 Tax=Uncinula necator TaxID=52586 RepID=A0A0B1P923_UNCNE|nr:putative air1 domain-containing protein [Erysiphe necator]